MEHARTYLSNFGAVPRIYQDMRTEAAKASPAIDFNRQYPNSSAAVVEPHVVPGEFTRSGFAFMQDAVRHPDRYFQGETWVLGEQSARSLDTASVSKQLMATYSADFIKEWHAFLTEAHVVPCGSLHEAPEKLNTLAGPESPMLEFFYTVSSNTAVADQQIRAIFQPAQVLVDPNATARFIGTGNTSYVNALLSLANAVNQFNQNPDTARDMLNSAVSAADLAVQQTAQAFNVDPLMHTEKTVISLLEAPIRCAATPPPPGPPAAMCSTLGKFPFVALSKSQVTRDLTTNEQASLEEVNSFFAPGTGKSLDVLQRESQAVAGTAGWTVRYDSQRGGTRRPGICGVLQQGSRYLFRALPIRHGCRGIQLYSSLPAQQGDSKRHPGGGRPAHAGRYHCAAVQMEWSHRTSGFPGLRHLRSIAVPGNLGALPACQHGPCHAHICWDRAGVSPPGLGPANHPARRHRTRSSALKFLAPEPRCWYREDGCSLASHPYQVRSRIWLCS